MRLAHRFTATVFGFLLSFSVFNDVGYAEAPFLAPPQHVGPPQPEHAASNCRMVGSASFTTSAAPDRGTS